MKTMISKTAMLLALCTALFSFSSRPGGEGFEIYLNNKIVLQQYGSDMDQVKNLQLSQGSADDKLRIRYHHCGKVGKNRLVTIRDAQNNVLKEFRYADMSSDAGGMNVPVKDILDLKKSSTALKLYYSSTELPAGRMLVQIKTGAVIAGL